MKFLIDSQLPPALARFIAEELDCESLHVANVGLQCASDYEIWLYASANDMILITKDEDFVDLFFQRPNARLVWVRLGNARRVFLLDAFRQVLDRIVQRLGDGERFIELR